MTETANDAAVDRRALIAQLFAAQSGRKLDDETASAYLLALRRMDTPRLARVVEKILGDIEVEASPYRAPSPSRIWEVAREMRKLPSARDPAPVLELHGAPEQRFDNWDTAANQLLLHYLGEIMRDQRRDAKGALLRPMSRYAPDSPKPAYPGPLTQARTAILVKWKNLWARDMREDRELYDGKLDGRKAWADCMAGAEAEIDKQIASERAAA